MDLNGHKPYDNVKMVQYIVTYIRRGADIEFFREVMGIRGFPPRFFEYATDLRVLRILSHSVDKKISRRAQELLVWKQKGK